MQSIIKFLADTFCILFEIRFGNFAEDEALITVAYIGLGENCFHLKWSSEHSLSDEQTIEVTRNIEFYLKEKTDSYLIYFKS